MTALYYLAVDLGTSRTAAATARLAPDQSLLAAPFPLGRASDSAPSVVFAGDGELLFGDAAERRGLTQPDRFVREFKRRIGDEVPLVVGDRRFAPEDLYALLVSWVVETVSEREGALPAGIAVSVPVTWGPYRTSLVTRALAREGWPDAEIISEPEAAARHYESTAPLAPGHSLAVYDLGGGTFDAVLLRKDDAGRVGIIGTPAGMAHFGGADFDDAVFRRVLEGSGVDPSPGSDHRGIDMGLSALRRECIQAKESLSFDSEAVVPVLLESGHATVRLTRSEFEEMIENGIERTIDVLADAVQSAGIEAADLDAILLTGGSSRIPRVAQLLSERFDRPLAVNADPKAIIAMGAARAVADRACSGEADLAPGIPVAVDAVVGAASEEIETAPHPVTARTRRRLRRVPTAAYIAGGSLLLASGIVVSTATALGSAPMGADEAVAVTRSTLPFFPFPGGPLAAQPATPPALEPVAAPENDPASPPSPRPRSTSPLRAADATDDTFASALLPRTTPVAPAAIAAPQRPTAEPLSTPPAQTTTQQSPAEGTPLADPAPADPSPADPSPSPAGPADPADPPSPEPEPQPSEPAVEQPPAEADPAPAEPAPAPEPPPAEPSPDPSASPDPV